ncbi:hypothetical protein WDW86_08855 [Bdellovibrionota bacterium FG-2]
MTGNSPLWAPDRQPFQEVWYLKLNDPSAQRALWLRFTLLVSHNGFKRIAEVWAIFFQRGLTKDISKIALKQTFSIENFANNPSSTGIQIAQSELTSSLTKGAIQSKGNSIEWDLKISSAQDYSFNMVPETLSRLKVVKNTAVTVAEDLRFTGTSKINGETVSWNQAPGMQGHLSGPKNGHSWTWGHCNCFTDEKGNAVPFVFDGLTARAQVAGAPTPWLSTFFFLYRGTPYRFNTLWDALRVRSSHSHTEWSFQADRGELSFRGEAKAEHKDFAGVTYEDTNGSLLYCANSKLSNMKIHVYRRGKLESTFVSNGNAAFEVVSREKNPYVPILI